MLAGRSFGRRVNLNDAMRCEDVLEETKRKKKVEDIFVKRCCAGVEAHADAVFNRSTLHAVCVHQVELISSIR